MLIITIIGLAFFSSCNNSKDSSCNNSKDPNQSDLKKYCGKTPIGWNIDDGYYLVFKKENGPGTESLLVTEADMDYYGLQPRVIDCP